MPRESTVWYPHEGGALNYRIASRFGVEPETMPDGWQFGRVSAVVGADDGRVYVAQRGRHAPPVVVFDRAGSYVSAFGSWDERAYAVPHGLRLDPEGNVWLVDCGSHQVHKFSPDGEPIASLGQSGISGSEPNLFDQPTDCAFGPDGSIYVADGYGNSRVVRFDSRGRFDMAWGRRGDAPAEFNTPHSIVVDQRGTVYVADRNNNRLQVFDRDGRFLHLTRAFGAIMCIAFSPTGTTWILAGRDVAELLASDALSCKAMQVDLERETVAGSFQTPGHWIHEASDGAVYVAGLTGNVIRATPVKG